jgi:hypothetical protein
MSLRLIDCFIAIKTDKITKLQIDLAQQNCRRTSKKNMRMGKNIPKFKSLCVNHCDGSFGYRHVFKYFNANVKIFPYDPKKRTWPIRNYISKASSLKKKKQKHTCESL